MLSSNTSQVSNDATYIEDVFSTYLYTGNGSTQTITNRIDVTGKGALVWIKNRSDVKNNILVDTARGANNWIASNLTNAQASDATKVSSFSSTGFTVGSDSTVNLSTQLYASWTFRKQPKFFDVVTYTGNGVSGRQIAHNLGSTPGCIIIKCTSTATVWPVYHRSLGGTNYLRLNTTDASVANSTFWNNTDPTSTVFTVGNAQGTNQNTATYVAYLFAHNAGGFGLTGTDNVISCGSYEAASGQISVTLGYEPQTVFIKRATGGSGNWVMVDTMRGMTASLSSPVLYANAANAESAASLVAPTATGFTVAASGVDGDVNTGIAGNTYIYIAIRRGPMKTPTSGTSVFNAFAGADTSAITTNFPVDFFIENARVLNSANSATGARLLGGDVALVTSSTAATQTGFFSTTWYQSNTSYLPGCFGTAVAYAYRRAPSFFDAVCYTANNGAVSPYAITHNLTVVPELIIVKNRSTGATDWAVYSSTLGNNKVLLFNSTAASSTTSATWATTTPTATYFYVGNSSYTNLNFDNYVAYLFASCPGVSKVGSYTGNGSSQTINCGFTGGARFVMIKRTDSTGDWYVWDTARGIVSANDPRLSLNTTAAEVTTDDSIDPDNSGFIVNQVSATNINVSSATYIYLAIA